MDADLSTTQSVVGALAIGLLLAGLHLAAPRIRKLPFIPETATGSFAGGLAVAYVFLHLLPEIAEGNEAIGEALADAVRPTPLLDLGIFLVALLGFTAFYGLERLADRSAAAAAASGPTSMSEAGRRRDLVAVGAHADGGAAGDRGTERTAQEAPEPPAGVYRLHLASFLVYNGLITYTMPLRLRTGVLFAVLFTVAMGLHFVLTDRGLAEHYPRQFGSGGRAALAAALLGGWALAALVAPTSALLVAVLTALLGGSILLNVFKEEVPSNRRSSFAWFLTGLTLYAGLLAAVTAVAE
jgi:hypothetical protein